MTNREALILALSSADDDTLAMTVANMCTIVYRLMHGHDCNDDKTGCRGCPFDTHAASKRWLESGEMNDEEILSLPEIRKLLEGATDGYFATHVVDAFRIGAANAAKAREAEHDAA